MYATCLFCNTDLGTNDVVEAFPVGRRLAFDEARGRLWVVCRKCERWNLSPLEERWEAVEACERLFRATRMRVSTENIGLARLKEGLELVRIGKPQRPEFAAWRYGDQFGRRRKRAILIGGGAAIGFGALMVGGMAAGIGGVLLPQSGNFINMWTNARTRVRIKQADGRVLKFKNPDLKVAKFLADDEHGWTFEVGKGKKKERFVGEEAQRVAGLVVPKLNRAGGSHSTVADAVTLLESRGGPHALVEGIAIEAANALRTPARRIHPNAPTRAVFGGGQPADRTPPNAPTQPAFGPPRVTTAADAAVALFWNRQFANAKGELSKLPKTARLALEMALHEEQERRALEGELAILEAAWREAEEIAAIADDLLLAPGTDRFIERHRTDRPDEAEAG